MLAIIGGSGLSFPANLQITQRQVARTPFGEPSGVLTYGTLEGAPVVFLARHGYGHTIPPHLVNYRANIWALANTEAVGIISVTSVGCIRNDLTIGDLVIPEQLIDYTYNRQSSFFEGGENPEDRLDFAWPFCQKLQQSIIKSAIDCACPLKVGAVLAVAPGPRHETAAEVIRYQRDGADMIGMTAMPEAVLARELQLPFASINLVSKYAAGIANEKQNDYAQRQQLKQTGLSFLLKLLASSAKNEQIAATIFRSERSYSLCRNCEI